MSTMGIECRFVDPADPENFRRASDAKTRCYYGETLPNPKLDGRMRDFSHGQGSGDGDWYDGQCRDKNQ